jgi:niacin transporter
MSDSRKITYTALFLAFGVIVPQIFHLFGGAGPIFLPMHIPVLLAGFYLGGIPGALIGFLSPLFSSFLTGMPVIPILYFMMVEVTVYGFASGYFYKKLNMNIYVSLILSMILGRVFLAAAVFMLQPLLGLNLSPTGYLIGALTSGIPGMAIQLIFVPTLVKLMEKAGGSIVRNHA